LAGSRFKDPAEAGGVREPAGKGDLGGGEVSGAQQVSGLAKAAILDEPPGRDAGLFMEQPNEMRTGKTGVTGHLIDADRFRKASTDEVHGLQNPLVHPRMATGGIDRVAPEQNLLHKIFCHFRTKFPGASLDLERLFQGGFDLLA
jgi:hypothetical protein